MTNFTTTIDRDYYFCLECEQDDIVEYFALEQENTTQQEIITKTATLSDQQVIVLLNSDIELEEILQLYPNIGQNRIESIMNTAFCSKNSILITTTPNNKSSKDLSSITSCKTKYKTDDTKIESIGILEFALDIKQNIDRYKNKSSNLLIKLNRKWQRQNKKHNYKNVVINTFMFHCEEDGDGNGMHEYFNVLWCFLTIGAQRYNLRVIETWNDWEKDDGENYKFEVAIDINEHKLKMIKECLGIYLTPNMVSIVIDYILDMDEDIYIHHPYHQEWMVLYFCGKYYNGQNEYFHSSEMDKCHQYSKLLHGFILSDQVQLFQYKHGTHYFYSIC